MEITNVTPKEFRRILWHITLIALIVLVGIAAWRAPDIIRAIAFLKHG